MTSYQQDNANASWQVGIASYASASQEYGNAAAAASAATASRHGWRHLSSPPPSSSASSSDAPSSKGGMKLHRGGRRLPRSSRFRPGGISLLVVLVLCIVSITIIGGDYLVSLIRNRSGENGSLPANDFSDGQDRSMIFSLWNGGRINSAKHRTANQDGDVGESIDSSHEQTTKALQFGDAFVEKEELLNRDSRYWDKDDRKRDKYLDYNTDDPSKASVVHRTKILPPNGRQQDREHKHSEIERASHDAEKLPAGNAGLYNERGRKELRMYEEEFEAAMKQELESLDESQSVEQKREGGGKDPLMMMEDDGYDDYAGNFDEYETLDESVQQNLGDEDHSQNPDNGYDDFVEENQVSMHYAKAHNSSAFVRITDGQTESKVGKVFASMNTQENTSRKISQSLSRRSVDRERMNRRSKRRRHAGYPCEIDFLETTQGLIEPDPDPRFATFSLRYITEEDSGDSWGLEPRFAGHQSLQQREQSFVAANQSIHCGFVQDSRGFNSTGFDIKKEDIDFLNTCKIAVSSCIFGSSDNIRSPKGGKLTHSFKKEVCFAMFVDQETLDAIKQDGQEVDENGYVGLWKIIVVQNMPYLDARRVGKIPKLLTHRLFPSARYSVWLDSKLRLQSDPILILEYFLWRGGHEYAISNHYDRHCVWEEVQQNKKLNKYNHTAIDKQFEFYQADGLARFNASDRKKLLPSNVPEGSFIIRAHTPMSNLFSCLWFNEVDRFTSRDQLSFAYTYMKLVKTNPDKHFYLNMFKDCERKAIAKLFRHRKVGSSTMLQRI